jgi:hypothetical protein
VKAFPMVMGQKLVEQVPEMPFPEDYEMAEALVSDRSHKPLCVRVAVWALSRNPHALHPSLQRDCFERRCERRIAVVGQVRRVSKEAVDRVGQLAPHLQHPFPIGVCGDASDLRPAFQAADRCDFLEESRRRSSGHHGVRRKAPGTRL